MKKIEVFKTDIRKLSDANNIIEMLLKHFPGYRVNFDLSDRDKILRIETQNGMIDEYSIRMLLKQMGHFAEVLPD